MMPKAAEPLNTRDIALELLEARAIEKRDMKLLRLMTKRAGLALQTQPAGGTIWPEQGTRGILDLGSRTVAGLD